MTGPAHLLVVDDEPFNLEIIGEYFDGLNYSLDTAEDGEAAWQRLNDGTRYDLVILDRMMPVLDGLALLKRMKATPSLAPIPVVMQTAAGEPEQVREGLAAGAHYYLVKPYERDSLLSIVRSALDDYTARRRLQDQLAQHGDALKLMKSAEFSLRSIEEASALSAFLARICPQPESAVLGISELLVNAIEHGNLGISYVEKSELKRNDSWHEEILRRLALPENINKVVQLKLKCDGEHVTIRIQDQGAGFDWEKFLDFDPQRAFDPNGRGIALARMASFESLAYEGNGSTVIATLRGPQ